MSSLVFPSLPGLDIKVNRTPIFATEIQVAASGKEQRAAFQSFPRYKWALTLNFARNNGQYGATYDEPGTLLRFFFGLLGSWDSFLFADPYESAVVAQPFGTGNASATAFQLQRCDPGNWSGPASNYYPATGSGFEPIFDLQAPPQIYINGVLKTVTTDYTISATGLVTFTAAPGAGTTLTWTGSYYRRVRFDGDSLELERMFGGLYDGKVLKLVSVK